MALLNSKLADWYLRKLCVSRNGGYVEYKPMFIKKIPLPKLPKENREHLSNCAKKISLMKLKGENTEQTEKEIDELVYEIFKLTSDEIQFIEMNK